MKYNYLKREFPWPELTASLKTDNSPKGNATADIILIDEESLLELGELGFLVGQALEDYLLLKDGQSLKNIIGEKHASD